MQALPQKIKEVDDASYFLSLCEICYSTSPQKVILINMGEKRKVFKV